MCHVCRMCYNKKKTLRWGRNGDLERYPQKAGNGLSGAVPAWTYSILCHDVEGRAAIRYDGKEILKGCYWNNWTKAEQFPKDETYETRKNIEMAYMDDTALKLGIFDQRCFYSAFEEFDNQAIEKSLLSQNLLVRIFALLDRRVGKRKLMQMRESMKSQPEMVRLFYDIRVRAEGLL